MRFILLPALSLSLLLTLGLAGCTSPKPNPKPNPSYVVLLPDANGTVGKVLVSNAKGSTTLDQANQGALAAGEPGQSFLVDAERLKKDFGDAMAASPQAPRTFVLFFETGGATLTAASRKELSEVLSEIKNREGVDLSVVGHTDTAGEPEANYQLGLKRAQIVAGLIGQSGVSSDRVAVESHGDKNPSVPTPANTNEPRNRRVEVTVR